MAPSILLLCLAWLWLGAVAFARQTGSQAPEMTSHESAATFQSKVNLVLVPVVVRDGQGRAIGTLKQDDFQLFDKGKPQTISRFSVEKRGGVSVAEKTGAEAEAEKASAMPERFVVYLFDDLHVNAGDLVNVQKAATRHLAEGLQAADRAAIFSTSGQTTLDFTDDRAKLQETVMKLRQVQLYRAAGRECPDISYYMADLIRNKNDTQALQAATDETLVCMNLTSAQQAQQMAQAAASQVLNVGEQDTRVTLSVIKDVLRRLAAMPGQRTIILASPGFFAESSEAIAEKADILDRAVRTNVMISALDARGLYTTELDASQQGAYSPSAQALISQYQHASALADEDVMAELADGTGGTYFHNNNDLNEGFKRVAAAPEYYYLLGFSPHNLKPDGTFHKLKISVANARGLSVEARRGYLSPKRTSSDSDNAKADIEDAVFSREEMHDFPVYLRTQFFKPGPADAKLTVLARVDVQHIRFKKLEGRNHDSLTIVSAVFDRNGNYVAGTSKTLEMRLRDETLSKLSSGVTVKTSFDIKPGTYLVRLVVRDAEGQLMSAQNGAVDIP